jgi:hypothetical protein
MTPPIPDGFKMSIRNKETALSLNTSKVSKHEERIALGAATGKPITKKEIKLI